MKKQDHMIVRILGLVAGLVVASGASALPSAKIGTAALIRPDDANTSYGSATTSSNTTGATTRPVEIIELARALNNNVDAIYDFVRNNIDTSFMYGLNKGALGTLVERSGTPFDQAQLMVELLRQAGYTASYKVGTITLTGSQFNAWTGVYHGVAACQLLSSGGIPAIVNGFTNTTCSGVGTSISNITLSHIWVEVWVPGSTCANNLCQFDPSYKPYSVKVGRDVLADAGLTTGQALTQATSGYTNATDPTGVTYVRSLNATSLATQLTSYGNALQTAINTNVSTGEPEDLVGGRSIVRYDPPAGQPGLRQASIPFSPAVVHNWTGDIPDQYRTSLRVQVTRGAFSNPAYVQRVDKTVFADEIGGRMLVYSANFNPLQNGTMCSAASTSTLSLVSEDGTQRNLASYTESANSQACNPRYNNGEITLTVNHPYKSAANGTVSLTGDYMDASVVKRVWYTTPMIIMHGFGDISRSGMDKWANVREGNMRRILPPGCEQCTLGYLTSTGYARRLQLTASWLAQTSVASRLHAQLAASVYTHHHSIGVVTGDTEVPLTRRAVGDGTQFVYTYEVSENFDRIDVEMGYSVTGRTANPNTRRAAIHAIAATVDALEGGVVGQNQDLPDVVSTATRFDWGNAPPSGEDPSGAGARRFYEFTSSNHGQAANLTKNEGITTTSDDGIHSQTVAEIGQTEINARRNSLNGAISNYAQAGFTVIAAEDSFLGPGQRAGSFVAQGSPPNTFRHEMSKQRGGALVATRYVSGEPVEIAHVAVSGGSFGSTVTIKGGGGGAQPQQQSLYDPATAADVLKARFVDKSSMLGVDMHSGSVTYSSPASLRVGAGGFPYELTANLLWRNGVTPTDMFGPVSHIAPQMPWTTNWHNNLGVSSSAMEVMGEGDVRGMAGTVAAFIAMQDVYRSSASKQREVAANMIAAWWLKTLSGNTVTASVGTDTKQFVRQFNGTWFAPGAGAVSTLTQTGSRAIIAESGCGSIMYPTSRGWSYDAVTFTVTNATGDVQTFSPWKVTVEDVNATSCAYQRGHRISNWSFPQGMGVTFTYGQPQTYIPPVLIEVTNSLGRKIAFTYTDGKLNGLNNGLSGADRRAVGISISGDTYSHTDPSGAVSRVAATIVNNKNLLVDVFDPDDTATVPSIRYTYDSLQRVKEVRDAASLQSYDARGPYQFFIGDGVRAERRDPEGGRVTLFFDLNKKPLATIDELGRQTAIKYDGRGRVLEYTYPELDREQFEYDARNNITRMIKVAKPCSPQPCTQPANLVTQASWNSTWNKPDYIINPRGFRTDFAYYSTGNGRSLMQTATRPGASGAAPIGTSTRPAYLYTYNAFGQVLDFTDPTGLITRNVYSGTASTLQSTTTNPGGVNSTISYTYTAQGDQLTVTNARGFANSFEYDSNRRKTVSKMHNGASTANVMAATRTTYDLLGQVRKEEGGTAFSGISVTAWQTIKDVTYTPTGKVRTETDNANNVTNYSYDFVDRVRIVTDPESRRTATVYDLAGQSLCTWRAWNSATAPTNCIYDPAAYVVGSPIRYGEYTYSANGQQATIKDANNNLSTYVYDGFDRVVRIRFPVATKGAAQSSTTDFEEFGLDANGNRTSLRKRDGRVINFVYDNLDRQRTKDIPDSTSADVYSDYDLAGRPSYARLGSTSGTGIDYAYDSAKRLQSESTFGRTLTYGYDLAGNRVRLTYPDANYVDFDFDALNRNWRIREMGATSGAGVLTTITWDALSRRDFAVAGNATSTDFGYDAASRLNMLTQDLTGSSKDMVRSFTHNGAGQLRTRSTTGTVYDYVAPLASRAFTANGLNRYTGGAFTYDANGNLTADGSRTFVYDVENRLTRVTSAGVQTDLTYDPMGRLASTTTAGVATNYVYDGDRLVAEYNGSSTVLRRYVHGSGLDEPIVWYEGAGLTVRRWLHADERGSIVATSDSSGNGTEYTYGPYGEPGGDVWSGPRFRYTGQIAIPEARLYHYKARVYDPSLGRFLQTDPVGYKDALNLYEYSASDPINNTDPSGEIVNFLVKFGADVALTLAVQIASGQPVNIGAALKEGAEGLVNPAKTLQKAQKIAKLLKKMGDEAEAAYKAARKNGDSAQRAGQKAHAASEKGVKEMKDPDMGAEVSRKGKGQDANYGEKGSSRADGEVNVDGQRISADIKTGNSPMSSKQVSDYKTKQQSDALVEIRVKEDL